MRADADACPFSTAFTLLTRTAMNPGKRVHGGEKESLERALIRMACDVIYGSKRKAAEAA